METAVIEGLQLWQYGPLVGSLGLAVGILAYFLIKSSSRNRALVDWVRDYAAKAAQSNVKNAALIDKLIAISVNNNKDVVVEINKHGERQLNALKLLTIELTTKIDSMRNEK